MNPRSIYDTTPFKMLNISSSLFWDIFFPSFLQSPSHRANIHSKWKTSMSLIWPKNISLNQGQRKKDLKKCWCTSAYIGKTNSCSAFLLPVHFIGDWVVHLLGKTARRVELKCFSCASDPCPFRRLLAKSAPSVVKVFFLLFKHTGAVLWIWTSSHTPRWNPHTNQDSRYFSTDISTRAASIQIKCTSSKLLQFCTI